MSNSITNFLLLFLNVSLCQILTDYTDVFCTAFDTVVYNLSNFDLLSFFYHKLLCHPTADVVFVLQCHWPSIYPWCTGQHTFAPSILVHTGKEGRKCFIYRYTQHILFTVIWLRTIPIAREETRCHHMGYFFWLAARVLLYASPPQTG